MHLSIVIPLLNEQESLHELMQWIFRVFEHKGLDYEVIFIDDGSTDDSWKVITDLSLTYPQVKGIRFMRNYGKSQALHAGFDKAKGNVVITMDADLQDSPDELPELYRMIDEEGYHLVSGWKKKRYDAVIAKNIPSKLFNWAARKTSGVLLHDFNCGLKAYQKKVVKNIHVSGEMHRYIPVLAKNAGFSRITEKVVQHQARKYGETKFGANRFINGFLDLITIWFLSTFGKRPMHFFGAIGVVMFGIGLTSAAYIGINKLFRLYNDLPYDLITNNPWFFISLTTMIMGTQFFLAGFIGELILRSQPKKAAYSIDSLLNFDTLTIKS